MPSQVIPHRTRARAVRGLLGAGLIGLVLLSLGAGRPEGVVLALVVVGAIALHRRARPTRADALDTGHADEPPALPTIVAELAGRDHPLPPRPVIGVALLALLQIPVLVGIGATTLVLVDALASPTGGATASRTAGVVGILVLAAIPSLVPAIGVWRGREGARTFLLGLCRVRIGASALACLMFFTMATPLVLLLLDHRMRHRLQDPRTVGWCALTRAPGPGSPPR